MFTSRCGESLVVAAFRPVTSVSCKPVTPVINTAKGAGSKALENSETSSSVAVLRAVSI